MKTKKTYQITGMSCASCAARIDKVLNAQPGVCEATINYATASAQVVYDSDECSDQSLKTAVQNAGYDLLTDTGNDTNEEAEQAHAKVPVTENPNNRSGSIGSACYGNQHVVFRAHTDEIYSVDSIYNRGSGLRTQFLRPCVETIKTWIFKHGYTGSHQHRNSLSVQCIQPAFPRFLVIARRSSASLL